MNEKNALISKSYQNGKRIKNRPLVNRIWKELNRNELKMPKNRINSAQKRTKLD